MFCYFFFTDNNESCESLWNRVCVKEPDGLREEALYFQKYLPIFFPIFKHFTIIGIGSKKSISVDH